MSVYKMEEFVGLDKINHKRDLTPKEIELQEQWIKLNGKPIRKELHPDIEKLFRRNECIVKTIQS